MHCLHNRMMLKWMDLFQLGMDFNSMVHTNVQMGISILNALSVFNIFFLFLAFCSNILRTIFHNV